MSYKITPQMAAEYLSTPPSEWSEANIKQEIEKHAPIPETSVSQEAFNAFDNVMSALGYSDYTAAEREELAARIDKEMRSAPRSER